MTETIDTWTANARGELTLPMLLEEGDYTLKEVQAPCGYVKELEGKTFHVGDGYNGWENPLVIEFSNMPQKATITVAKTDSWTGEAVDESVYIVKAAETIQTPDGTIRANEGEIVATLTTGEDGKVTTPSSISEPTPFTRPRPKTATPSTWLRRPWCSNTQDRMLRSTTTRKP